MQSTTNFNYKINFSRRRTLSIIISPDKGVIVKAPYRTPVKAIAGFVNEKSDWIVKNLDKFNSLVRMDHHAGYFDGDKLLLFGREHKLKLINSNKYSVRLVNDSTIEADFKIDNNPLIIKALLDGWFKFIARSKLSVKFRETLVKYNNYGFKPTGFVVRSMRTRWGSCSSKGKIALSSDLIRLDEVYTEYVVVHELCHLKHHNHGAEFYKLLTEVYPGWKSVREGLKRYIR